MPGNGINGVYMSDNIISFKQVTKVYRNGQKALDRVNLEIEKGEFAFLLGDSGAGKTTLLDLILKETEPTGGEITVNGILLSQLKSRQIYRYRRFLGMVFQDFKLFQDFNVYENVAFAQMVSEAPSGQVKEQVMGALNRVGLERKARYFPDQLSGGEKQRVALARAIVNQPLLLLADEPTGNLDSRTSQDVLGLLKVTGNQFKQTIVMITHNEEIAQMADRIIRIEDGKILERR